eukprot:431386-Pelagomonas_calceolata.AAC.1
MNHKAADEDYDVLPGAAPAKVEQSQQQYTPAVLASTTGAPGKRAPLADLGLLFHHFSQYLYKAIGGDTLFGGHHVQGPLLAFSRVPAVLLSLLLMQASIL